MDRVSNEILRAVQEILRTSPDEDAILNVRGRQVRVQTHPEPGVETQIMPADLSDAAQPWVARSFTAGELPAISYPQTIPFIPGLPVVVWEPGPAGVITAAWSISAESLQQIRTLVRISHEQGWNEVTPSLETALRPPVFVKLVRSDAQRVISLLGSDDQFILALNEYSSP